MKIPYDEIKNFIEWYNIKFDLKFNPKQKTFPIFYNCIYWAHLGCNIGAEEEKHRPILITRTYKNSPICTILPITSKRLNDDKEYHIDLESYGSTVLCEQMRTIDISRIDKPIYKNGKILSITENDWNKIDFQIRKQYLLSKKS